MGKSNFLDIIMNLIKIVIKIVLSLLFNGYSLCRLKSIKFPYHIGYGLKTINPHKISISKNFRIGRFGKFECSQDNTIDGIIIEENVYIGQCFSVLAHRGVEIKHDTLVASFVTIGSEKNIELDGLTTYNKAEQSEESIIIGEFCWIGEKVVILPGVNIGDWSIIGASSVVVSDIPPYSIAVGNPAKVIKTYNFASHKWEAYISSNKNNHR